MPLPEGTPLSIIIQARLTSHRLPGKVLKPFGAHPVLRHVIRRCQAVHPEAVCVAIPSTPQNNALADWLRTENVPFYRGPEDDVLARYVIGAARMFNRQGMIVRITADCPLIDPEFVRELIDGFMGEPSPYYATNRIGRETARGLDAEIFTAEAITSRAFQRDVSAYEREHVTPYFRRPELLTNAIVPTAVHAMAGMRWTLDTPEDYAWFCRLAQHVNTEPPHPTTEEVLDYIAKTGDVRYEPDPA